MDASGSLDDINTWLGFKPVSVNESDIISIDLFIAPLSVCIPNTPNGYATGTEFKNCPSTPPKLNCPCGVTLLKSSSS